VLVCRKEALGGGDRGQKVGMTCRRMYRECLPPGAVDVVYGAAAYSLDHMKT